MGFERGWELSLELGYIQLSVKAQLDLAIWLFSLLLANAHCVGSSFRVLLPISSWLTRHMPDATLSPTHVAEGVKTTLDTALSLPQPRPGHSISKKLYSTVAQVYEVFDTKKSP